MILLSNRLHQNLQRLHLSLRQQPKLRTKEHEMLKTSIQMRRHLQCLQRPEETTINNPIDPKQATEYLSAQGCKLWSLKHTQRFRLIIVIGELRLIVDLIRYPLKHFFDVHGRRNTDGGGIASGSFGPTVFDSGGEAFTGTEGIEVGVFGHDCPDCGDVVVEVDGVDCYPACAGFARGESYRIIQTPTSTQRLLRIAMQSIP
mmetsp:Transcript_18815/g.40792  ORF Transcript_18815/g.40792 Transcript_18815/m.40792 type:complete len:202 (-) Transcript_18815:125-730(-)